MPLGIGRGILRGLRASKITDLKSFSNIEKFAGLESGSITMETLPSFFNRVKQNPHTIDQIHSIDAALNNPSTVANFNTKTLGNIFTGDPDAIKNVFTQIDEQRKVTSFTENLRSLGGITSKNLGGFLKDTFRGIEKVAQNNYYNHSAKLQRNIVEGAGAELRAESKQAFEFLLRKPEEFRSYYGLEQDDIIRALLGEESPSVTNNKVLNNLVKSFKQFDEDVIGMAQDLGVQIGQLEDYFLPFQFPKDSFYRLGKEYLAELLVSHTTLRAKSIRAVLGDLKIRADDTTSKTGIGYRARKIEFKSATDEIEFYKALNQLEPDAPLLPHILNHKQNLVKKASMISQFGHDPISTFNKTINNLLEGGDPEVIKEASRLKKNFQHLYDVYEGKLNVTSHAVEQTRRAFSQMTSILTGASGLGFVRTLITDFNANAAAVSNAVYNPNYNVGSAALGMVQDLGYVFARAFKLNNRTKKHVDELLDIMDFANSADSYTHHGLSSFEDIFDLGNKTPTSFADKAVDVLTRSNNAIQNWNGMHSLIDFRRFRHKLSFQQMWGKTLDNFSHKEWVESLDDIGKRQLKYLDKSLGLGAKEFNFLRQAHRYKFDHKGKNLDILSRESILETSEDIAKKFKRSDETTIDFLSRVSGSWARLINESTQIAAPTPTIVDSLSKNLNTANSWVRFILNPFFKFGDIAQSQWSGVVDRVSLAVYGDQSQAIGFDKSLLQYGKASSYYLGSAIGVAWMHDILRGRSMTDFREQKNVARAMSGSGFLGYPAMFISSFLNLYANDKGGAYSQAPASAFFRSGNNIKNALTKYKGGEMWYRLSEEMRKITGVGNMWWTRGLTSKVLQDTLLTPAQKRSLERRKNRRGVR